MRHRTVQIFNGIPDCHEKVVVSTAPASLSKDDMSQDSGGQRRVGPIFLVVIEVQVKQTSVDSVAEKRCIFALELVTRFSGE